MRMILILPSYPNHIETSKMHQDMFCYRPEITLGANCSFDKTSGFVLGVSDFQCVDFSFLPADWSSPCPFYSVRWSGVDIWSQTRMSCEQTYNFKSVMICIIYFKLHLDFC